MSRPDAKNVACPTHGPKKTVGPNAAGVVLCVVPGCNWFHVFDHRDVLTARNKKVVMR